MISHGRSLFHGDLPGFLRKPTLGLPNMALITSCGSKRAGCAFYRRIASHQEIGVKGEDSEEAQRRIRDIPVETSLAATLDEW